MRERIAAGEFPAARVRVTQLLFGPPVPFPVVFRVSGPDVDVLRGLSEAVRKVVAANTLTKDAFLDWGERASGYRLVLDQDRLRLLGFTPTRSNPSSTPCSAATRSRKCAKATARSPWSPAPRATSARTSATSAT
jgi:hypothetical protein